MRILAAFIASVAVCQEAGYFTYQEILDKVASWKKSYPALVHETSIGKTVEGRDIVAVRISDNAAKDEDEPELLLMAGIHPREQPPQVCLIRLVDEMLAAYGKDARITKLIDEREIWVIPCFNADGKVYDFKNGKDKGLDWRKNRHKNENGTHGVDLNRNFGIRWGGSTDLDTKPTLSSNPKSNYYEGGAPMSEPEVKALAKFFEDRPLRAFIDMHSPYKTIFFPEYLSKPEAERFSKIARGMQELQKDKYKITVPTRDKDTSERRGGDSGVTYAYAYYTRGAYGFNLEIYADPGHYPPMEQIEKEYADNFKEPLLYFIEATGNLPETKKGNATLKEFKADGVAAIELAVTIDGKYDYAVLVSEDSSVIVTSEFRLAPAKPFNVQISKSAKPGTKIPFSLYIWNRDHAVSTAEFELTIQK